MKVGDYIKVNHKGLHPGKWYKIRCTTEDAVMVKTYRSKRELFVSRDKITAHTEFIFITPPIKLCPHVFHIHLAPGIQVCTECGKKRQVHTRALGGTSELYVNSEKIGNVSDVRFGTE